MLLARVQRTLEERGLLRGSSRVLVACSGGPDSTALLHALHALQAEHGKELLCASVNHGLRAEAAQDVACAERNATSLGIPFFPLRVTVTSGASRQAHARRARYEALLRCAAEQGASCVAVGHTQEDQAETVLSRLLRGTGVHGLAGITPAREDGVIRPLIDCRRRDVLSYVQTFGLEVVQDPSNEDLRFERVRIRKQLLPLLEGENPQFVPSLAALADEARAARQLIEQESRRILNEGPPNAHALEASTPEVKRWVLKHWCETQLQTSLLRTHLEALEGMLRKGGEVRLPGDWLALLDAERNVVLRRNQKRGRGSARRTQGDSV